MRPNRSYNYNKAFKPRSLRRTEKKIKQNIVLVVILSIIIIYALLNWGLPLLIDSLSLFKGLQSKTETVKALEDAAIAPPFLNIPFEATNSATIDIQGYASPNLKIEIYVDDNLKTTVQTDSEGNFKAENILLELGINNIYGKTVNEEGAKSLSSKNIKVIYSNDRPTLEISEPGDGSQIKGGDKKVKVSGKTDPDSSVTVNSISAIIRNDGTFSTEVNINDGDNIITVVATNSVSNSSKVERKVNYAP